MELGIDTEGSGHQASQAELLKHWVNVRCFIALLKFLGRSEAAVSSSLSFSFCKNRVRPHHPLSVSP